jgi:hypothetical protein
MIMNPMRPVWELSMGVHRVVLKSDKIPLNRYYLEVFASNGHSQVTSWTFVMGPFQLDPPYDY